MTRRAQRLLQLSLLAGLYACTGTETGNPSFTGTLEYNAYSSAPASVALLSHGGGKLNVQSTWLVLGDVDFVPTDECASNVPSKVHAEGLGAGDHAKPGAAQTPVELDAGDYCGVRLPLLLAGDKLGSAPAALAGHSMLIEGTNAGGIKFSLRSRLQSDLFLRADHTSFALTKDSKVVLIAFDVATWLDGLDWGDAAVSAGGTIEIDEDSNTNLLTAYEEGVAKGVALYRDDDADGEVSDGDTALAHGAQ